MKNIKPFFSITIIVFIFNILLSCDLILPAPLGRNNPMDDEAQIGRFEAVASGPDSIVTAWDWRSPSSGIDDSRIIDKIRIVYSENSYPTSKYPLDQNKAVEISSSSEWSHEWKDLRENRDYYFALYAHEKGGVWLAPKYTRVWINNNGSENRWDIVMMGNVEKLYVDTSLPTNPVQVAAMNITGPFSTIGFFRFDDFFNDPGYGMILEAQIQDWNLGVGGDFLIVPMRKRIEDGMIWGDIGDISFYDYSNAKAASVFAFGDIVDIKDQMNISRLHGSNTIAFISNDPAFNVGITTLTFFDGSTDRFSVWRND